jgi:hypothetical protein
MVALKIQVLESKEQCQDSLLRVFWYNLNEEDTISRGEELPGDPHWEAIWFRQIIILLSQSPSNFNVDRVDEKNVGHPKLGTRP